MSESLVGVLIAEEAERYIGQQEKKGNMGFKSKSFDKLMRSIGFTDTHAWCAYFCELVWTQFYFKNDHRKLADCKRLFTAGAVRTYRKFSKDPNWETSQSPVLGAVAIWQKYKHGKATQWGHAAIVVGFTDTHITTIDGNTNDKGGREGYIVAKKSRLRNPKDGHGLVLKGFILPNSIES